MTLYMSWSQVQTYLTCPKKFEYRYIDNLEPVRFDETKPMYLGSVFHDAMASVLRDYAVNSNTSLDHLVRVARDAIELYVSRFEDTDSIGLDVLGEYDIEFKPSDVAEKAFEIVVSLLYEFDLSNYVVVNDPSTGEPMVEYALDVPIPEYNDIRFIGYIDAVMYNKITGRTEIIDWKTTRSLKDASSMQLHGQMAVYAYFLRQQTGINAEVQSMVQVASTPPRKPEMTKSGMMSRANIRTTWETYRRALLKNNLNPDDYLDMRNKLIDTEFVRKLELYRNQDTLVNFVKEFIAGAHQARNSIVYPRVINSFSCDRCTFSRICLAYLHNHDVDGTLVAEYKQREDKYSIDAN